MTLALDRLLLVILHLRLLFEELYSSISIVMADLGRICASKCYK